MEGFFGTATGRPYRIRGRGFEGSRGAPLTGADDASLLELLLIHPDFLDDDALLWSDGRVIEGSDPGGRTLVGWHRRGGPILLSATTGAIGETDLVEALHLARITSGWTISNWGEIVARFWRDAPGELVAGVVERWGLEGNRILDPAAWGDAAWAAAPAPGPTHVGLLGGAVDERLRRVCTWLRDSGIEIAAFVARRIENEGGRTYVGERVAGGWHAAPRRPLPGEEEESLRRETNVRRTGEASEALLSALERRCLEVGGDVEWSGEEWVRLRGPSRSIRVFPGSGRVDLQLVGADEGTLTGLRYRYGIPLSSDRSPAAPPGTHLRLSGVEDLTPNLEALVGDWLGGRSSAVGPGEGDRGVTPDPLGRASGRARDRRDR